MTTGIHADEPIYICFRLHLLRYVRPYELYNGLVVMGLGPRIIREELGWSSMTARRITWGRRSLVVHTVGIMHAEPILASFHCRHSTITCVELSKLCRIHLLTAGRSSKKSSTGNQCDEIDSDMGNHTPSCRSQDKPLRGSSLAVITYPIVLSFWTALYEP